MSNWDELPDRYWHCYVLLEGRSTDREALIINDMTKDRLRSEIVDVWRAGAAFTIADTTVSARETIAKIKIAHTDQPQQYYAARHRAELRKLGVDDLVTNPRASPFLSGTDHTHDLLFAQS